MDPLSSQNKCCVDYLLQGPLHGAGEASINAGSADLLDSAILSQNEDSTISENP
jgi:hypothetical protein